MANIKRKVSASDYIQCYAYFERAIQNKRFLKGHEQDAVREHAINAFLIIPKEPANTLAVQSLQNWIDQYVDYKTWGKCYRAINQKKHIGLQGKVTINLSMHAHAALKSYAEDNKLTLSDAIIHLVENANSLDNLVEDYTDDTLESNQASDFFEALNLSLAGNNVTSLFRNGIPDSYLKDDLFRQQTKPCRPPDFKQNDSYKVYRKRILNLTIKNPDDILLSYFEKHVEKPLSYFICADNLHDFGDGLITLRQELLDNNLLFKEIDQHDFAISQTIALPSRAMAGYGDDLIFLIGEIMGCSTPDITSGKKELTVFAGHRNNVQIAYKTFNYMNAFLQEEYDLFVNKVHKNTKQKNRYKKAGWHSCDLLFKMLNSILDEEVGHKLFTDEEESNLYKVTRSKVSLYYDESRPIGGWY